MSSMRATLSAFVIAAEVVKPIAAHRARAGQSMITLTLALSVSSATALADDTCQSHAFWNNGVFNHRRSLLRVRLFRMCSFLAAMLHEAIDLPVSATFAESATYPTL